MIRLIEALHYRCLRYVRQPLQSFHVLVGPNASGKTTFLDVVGFLGRLVADGLQAALEERTANFQDLVWKRGVGPFELAVEARIPDAIRGRAPEMAWDTIRYEVCIGIHPETEVVSILEESVILKRWREPRPVSRELFPMEHTAPKSIMTHRVGGGDRRVVRKAASGLDHFYSEVGKESGKGWFPSIRLGPQKSAFGNLPEDQSTFPAATWFKTLLSEGVQPIVLNSLLMKRPSPPGQPRTFKPDGSNLPWIVTELRKNPTRWRQWIDHVRTALPEVRDITTVEREEDRHRYLVIEYENGLKIPSWMVSDGTLRLLALTILAYLPSLEGVYLIEEPENGIHPLAVTTVIQSLRSLYEAQVLVATHSPVILSLVEAGQLLCFKKTPDGATDVVTGSEHPKLRDWKEETDLGTLFASGILG
ncbi:MAG: ATP-binding protein [Thermogutta sp.]